eukprot:8840710-Pyramimonas_sp.AAC.1
MPTAPQTAAGRHPGLPLGIEAEEAESHPGRVKADPEQPLAASLEFGPWLRRPRPLARSPWDPCGGSLMSVPTAPLL